jgi:polar amino acid transport system substrate-binding protein
MTTLKTRLPGIARTGAARTVAALTAAVLLAACDAPGGGVAPATTASARVPAPAGVQIATPTPAPSSSTAAPQACNVYASSQRPPATMPAPGAMPAGSTMAAIFRRGHLNVGVDQNTYHFGYRDPATGQIVGFDIDIAHAVAKAIFGDPSRINFVAITSAQRIPYVQNNTVDLVADTMTVTCQRMTQVSFSTIYYDAGQNLLVRKDSPIKGTGDLADKRVCAATGSTSIQNIAALPAHPVPVAVADWTDCLVMLQQGQVDAISTDDTILRGLAAQDPDTKLVLAKNFTDEPYGLAMNKSKPDFVAFVNGVLQDLRGNGGWAAIYDKWLGAPAPTPPPAGYAN